MRLESDTPLWFSFFAERAARRRRQAAAPGRGPRPGFEGGQIPLYRRLPKFVGRPMGPGHSKTLYGIVKLNVLNTVAEGSTVDYASLQEQRIVSKSKFKLKKVVGSDGEFTAKGLTVKGLVDLVKA